MCKSKVYLRSKNELEEEMKKEDCTYLFEKIEMPLSIVLGDMEYVGIRVDKSVLNSMNTEIEGRIKEISEKYTNLQVKSLIYHPQDN